MKQKVSASLINSIFSSPIIEERKVLKTKPKTTYDVLKEQDGKYLCINTVNGIVGRLDWKTDTMRSKLMLEVWHKMGFLPDEDNWRMQHGRRHEKEAIDRAGKLLSFKAEDIEEQKKVETEFSTAMLDAWHEKSGSVIEVKCPVSPAKFIMAKEGVIDPAWWLQCQFYYWLTGATAVYLAVFFKEVQDEAHCFIINKIPKDEQYFAFFKEIEKPLLENFIAGMEYAFRTAHYSFNEDPKIFSRAKKIRD